MATIEISDVEIEHSRGILTAKVTVTRLTDPNMVFAGVGPDANDLPTDVAEALVRWVLDREDMNDRSVALIERGMLP